MTRRHVLELVSTLGYGGIERWLLEVTPHVRDAGWEVTILAKGAEVGALAGHFRDLGCRVLHVSYKRSMPRYLRTLRGLASANTVVNSHLHDLSFLADLALVGKRSEVPVVLSFHNTTFHSPMSTNLLPVPALRPNLLRLPLRNSMRKASAITGCSTAVLEAIRTPSDKSATVYYGVTAHQDTRAHVTSLANWPKGIVSLFVGRLVPQKNVHQLIDSFRTVQEQVPEARLVIVGDGPLRGKLETQVDNAGLTGKVMFFGNCYDVRPLMAAANLLVMRSTHEGFGLVVAEAAAEGTVALLPSVPGLVEAGTLCGSMVVEAENPDTFASAWVDLLRDPEYRGEAGARAQRLTISNLSLRRSAENYVRVLDEVYCSS